MPQQLCAKGGPVELDRGVSVANCQHGRDLGSNHANSSLDNSSSRDCETQFRRYGVRFTYTTPPNASPPDTTWPMDTKNVVQRETGATHIGGSAEKVID